MFQTHACGKVASTLQLTQVFFFFTAGMVQCLLSHVDVQGTPNQRSSRAWQNELNRHLQEPPRLPARTRTFFPGLRKPFGLQQ